MECISCYRSSSDPLTTIANLLNGSTSFNRLIFDLRDQENMLTYYITSQLLKVIDACIGSKSLSYFLLSPPPTRPLSHRYPLFSPSGILGQIVFLLHEINSQPDGSLSPHTITTPSPLEGYDGNISNPLSEGVLRSTSLQMAGHLAAVRELSLSTVAAGYNPHQGSFVMASDNMVWYLLFIVFVSYGMLPLPLRWALLVGVGTSLLHLVLSVASFVLVRVLGNVILLQTVTQIAHCINKLGGTTLEMENNSRNGKQL